MIDRPEVAACPNILAIAACTCAADHTPPRGAEIPRSFNSLAIERSEFAPARRLGQLLSLRRNRATSGPAKCPKCVIQRHAEP